MTNFSIFSVHCGSNYLRNYLHVLGLLQGVKYIGLSLVILSRATLALHASAARISTSVSETLRYTCTATNAVRRSVAQGATKSGVERKS